MSVMQKTLVGAVAITLAACGGSSEPTDAAGQAVNSEFADIVETRQQKLKDLGGAFKSISDQLRSGEPDFTEIQSAASTVLEISNEDMALWFPEGSGPESGLDTDALATIWSERADFIAAHERLKTAAAELNEAAQGGDGAVTLEKFKAAGGACKNCHDKFRLDDD